MKFVRNIGCCCLCGLLLVTGCSTKQYEAKKTTEQSGEVFQIGDLELEVKGEDIREEVKPANPQGYYNHYKKEEGYHYHLLYGTLKNEGAETVNVNEIKVQGIVDKKQYQGKLVLINEIESYFWEEIEPGVTLEFYIFSMVEDKEKDPTEYDFYYDGDGKIEKKQETFDYKVEYKIPAKVYKDVILTDGNRKIRTGGV